MKLKVPTLWGMILQSEMQLTGNFVHLLEQHLPEWMAQVEMDIPSAPPGDDENAEAAVAEEEYQHQQAFQIATRPLAYGAFLAVWSMYESAVEAVARKRGAPIPRRNGNFIRRARRHFEHTLGISLHPSLSEDEWERMSGVGALRNVIAHQNGRLHLADPKPKAAVSTLIERDSRLQVSREGYVLVPVVFSRKLYDRLSALLNELLINVHNRK